MAPALRKIISLVAAPLFFLFCLCATNPVSLIPPDVDPEFKFAANMLYNYFIFRDSLPANPYAYTTPQALYEDVHEPYTYYLPKDSAGPLLQFLSAQAPKGSVSLNAAAAALAKPISRSVLLDTINATTAYIFISAFLSHTATPGGTWQEFENALAASAWATHTVLDLRGNPGGEIDQCLRVCGEFVPETAPIIASHERAPAGDGFTAVTLDTVFRSSSPHHALNRKFVCLTDSGTASAAEILVACLNSNRSDITTVGQKTYGKARGQVISLTPDSGLVRVTFALFRPVTGSPYDLVGIQPEVSLAKGNDALAAAVELIGLGAAKRTAASALSSLSRIEAQRTQYRFDTPFPLAILVR